MVGTRYEIAKRSFANGAVDKLARKLSVDFPDYECIELTTCLRIHSARTSRLCWEGLLRHKETGQLKTLGSYDRVLSCLKYGYKPHYDHPDWYQVKSLGMIERDIVVYANKPEESL